jgi:hypothetical protein
MVMVISFVCILESTSSVVWARIIAVVILKKFFNIIFFNGHGDLFCLNLRTYYSRGKFKGVLERLAQRLRFCMVIARNSMSTFC